MNRMLWASRRGMLELDLVLEPFVRNCYAHLSEQDKQRYRSLVTCEDQDLFDWFLRKGQPDTDDHKLMVKKILSYALESR